MRPEGIGFALERLTPGPLHECHQALAPRPFDSLFVVYAHKKSPPEARIFWCALRESNPHYRFRRPVLYPLS